MTTKLIELHDNVLVEVEVPEAQAQQIAGGFAAKVDTTLENIKPLLMRICRPVSAAWKELGKEFQIDDLKIELGLSFEGEGNLYITKTKAGANLTITLTLKAGQ